MIIRWVKRTRFLHSNWWERLSNDLFKKKANIDMYFPHVTAADSFEIRDGYFDDITIHLISWQYVNIKYVIIVETGKRFSLYKWDNMDIIGLKLTLMNIEV